MTLTDDQWRTLILKACEDNEIVEDEYDVLWERRADLLTVDPSGEMRYLAIVLDGITLILADAAKHVGTTDGGGESGEWGEYFDHWFQLQTMYQGNYVFLLKSLGLQVGLDIAPMYATSLTPVIPGYPFVPDIASPGYLGDPRYRRYTRWY